MDKFNSFDNILGILATSFCCVPILVFMVVTMVREAREARKAPKYTPEQKAKLEAEYKAKKLAEAEKHLKEKEEQAARMRRYAEDEERREKEWKEHERFLELRDRDGASKRIGYKLGDLRCSTCSGLAVYVPCPTCDGGGGWLDEMDHNTECRACNGTGQKQWCVDCRKYLN